jgi:hypothetical protein
MAAITNAAVAARSVPVSDNWGHPQSFCRPARRAVPRRADTGHAEERSGNYRFPPSFPMRPKHQQFVDELAKDWNATAAYKRAGYQARGHAAEVNASRLRKRPDVKAAAERVTPQSLSVHGRAGRNTLVPYARQSAFVTFTFRE